MGVKKHLDAEVLAQDGTTEFVEEVSSEEKEITEEIPNIDHGSDEAKVFLEESVGVKEKQEERAEEQVTNEDAQKCAVEVSVPTLEADLAKEVQKEEVASEDLVVAVDELSLKGENFPEETNR